MKQRRRNALALLALAISGVTVTAESAKSEAWVHALSATFDQLVEDGLVIGAQVVVGQAEQVYLEHHVGWRSHRQRVLVDADTRFGIGSDSKPMATAVIMKLVQEGRLQLDDPLSRWLPAYGSLQIRDGGRTARSPTVRETMTHRAGFYSQKKKLTGPQMRLIRDFSQTLEEAVQGIAQEPLLAEPGEDYAYSGAGYCVLGRVAEIAAKSTFEELLQSRLCEPLQLTRTTYFPQADDNVAVGARRVKGHWVPDPQAPHLTRPQNRFALIGGSIYSTARDQAKFAQMVLTQGRITNQGGQRYLSSQQWTEWIKRQSPRANYGLGWGQTFGAGSGKNTPTRLAHNGALGGYRASIVVNLNTGFFCTANWTLNGFANEKAVTTRIRTAIKAAEQAAAK